MGFLLAKIAFLLVLVIAVTAWLTQWWVLRQFEDVTESYSSTIHRIGELEAGRGGHVLSARFDAMEAQLKRLRETPGLAATDLEPLMSRIDDLDGRIGALPTSFPDIPTPEPVDLAPLTGRLAKLEKKVSELPTSFPDIPTPEPIDLDPITARLGGVEKKLETLSTGQLTTLEAKVEGLPALFPKPTVAKPVDFTALIERLAAIEGRIDAKPKRDPVDALARERRPGGGRNLLRRPAFGKPDALQQISGVGPKLEGMLHDIGVYYFWQVSRWEVTDVSYVDDLLDAFKGRIQRDDWVRQAVQLAAQPESAKAPA